MLKEKNPIISIIVPVYNVEKYLHRCIDSILAQTFTDFELILIDDGSKDNSGRICDEYAKKDVRIKVFHKENGGVSSARNLGLKEAIGEYIGWVDSDDYIENNMYECLYNSILNNEADLSYCDFNDKGVVTKMMQESQNKLVRLMEYLKIHVNSLCVTLVKRQIYLKNNIKFDEKNNYGEDLLVTTMLYYYASKVSYVSSIKYIYTFNPESICHTIDENKKRQLISNLEKLRDFFVEIQCDRYLLHVIASRILNEKQYFLYEKKNITEWYNLNTWTHKYIFKNKAYGLKSKMIEWSVANLYKLILKLASVKL